MSRSSPTLFNLIADQRISTLEKQRLIENGMTPSNIAVFFVPSMLTPLFINPESVLYDEDEKLFKLKEGRMLPDGLIPADKANDKVQLSTVLGRTMSMRKMLDLGVKIVVISASDHRAKTNDQANCVDEMEINAIKQRYDNFTVRSVRSELYQQMKEAICAATYFDAENTVGIRASQIHQPSMPATEAVQNPDIAALSQLLSDLNIESPILRSALVLE